MITASEPGLRAAVALGICTGMRESDVVALPRAAHADGRLEARQGKTGEPIWVPVHRRLKEILNATPRTSEMIVTGARGRPLTVEGFKAVFHGGPAKVYRAGRPEGPGGEGNQATGGGTGRHGISPTPCKFAWDPQDDGRTRSEHNRPPKGPDCKTPPGKTVKPMTYNKLRSWKYGVPGRIRTCDPRIRNPVLYPAELRGHLAPPGRRERGSGGPGRAAALW